MNFSNDFFQASGDGRYILLSDNVCSCANNVRKQKSLILDAPTHPVQGLEMAVIIVNLRLVRNLRTTNHVRFEQVRRSSRIHLGTGIAVAV